MRLQSSLVSPPLKSDARSSGKDIVLFVHQAERGPALRPMPPCAMAVYRRRYATPWRGKLAATRPKLTHYPTSPSSPSHLYRRYFRVNSVICRRSIDSFFQPPAISVHDPAKPLLTRTLTTTRRFSAIPFADSFEAAGLDMPMAAGDSTRNSGTPQDCCR